MEVVYTSFACNKSPQHRSLNNAGDTDSSRLRKVMTVSEVVNTISSLAQNFGFVNKYLHERFEFGIERITKRCTINFG